MELIFNIMLTAACVALTITLVATLRGIAELRLRIGGFTTDDIPQVARLDAGRALPDALVSGLSDPSEEALIIFLSESCETCWQVAADLEEIGDIAPIPIAVGIVGETTGELDAVMPRETPRLSSAVVDESVRELAIDVTPLAILQREGFILGTAYGASVSSEGLQGLLLPSQARRESVTS